MNKYAMVIAGVVVTSFVLNETMEDGHYSIVKEHTHEDYSYLSTNYSISPVAAATSSGDRAIL